MDGVSAWAFVSVYGWEQIVGLHNIEFGIMAFIVWLLHDLSDDIVMNVKATNRWTLSMSLTYLIYF